MDILFMISTYVAMRTGSSTLRFLLADHLGSTAITTDSNGVYDSEIRYYPWGTRRYVSGSIPTLFQFTGQRIDGDLGLYDYGARWSPGRAPGTRDPALGMFVQADTDVPESQDTQVLDRYIYAGNNPIKYTDQSGHCWGIASGLRGLPIYNITCQNLDMALSIVNNPDASFEEKVLAGGYIALEVTAHTGLVVGTTGLVCAATVPGCAKAVETVLGIGTAACADGNCTNEIEVAQNVWKMNPFDRGVAIENIIGRSPQLAQNFPVIDRFQNGIATSIKSIDLIAKSYQNITTLTQTVQGYINNLGSWQGATWGNYSIQASQIVGRELILAIPPGASQAQLQALYQLQQLALNQGVTVTLTIIK